MSPVTRFVHAVKDTFGEIKEALGLQKHAAIGRFPVPLYPRSLSLRSSEQIVEEQDGRPLARRASKSVPFEVRFQLLVLFIRQKYTGSLAGLKALESDVETLKSTSEKNGYHDAYGTLQAMSVSLNREITLKEAASGIAHPKVAIGFIPKAGGPIYGGW